MASLPGRHGRPRCRGGGKRHRILFRNSEARACSHHPQPIGDECEVDEDDEHEIKFLEPREDAAKALESAKQPFDLIAPLVHGAVVLPRCDPNLLGRHNRDEPKIERQLPCFIAFVRSVH